MIYRIASRSPIQHLVFRSLSPTLTGRLEVTIQSSFYQTTSCPLSSTKFGMKATQLITCRHSNYIVFNKTVWCEQPRSSPTVFLVVLILTCLIEKNFFIFSLMHPLPKQHISCEHGEGKGSTWGIYRTFYKFCQLSWTFWI